MALTRYAALLRGVSPMNAKMADLRRAIEGAGFSDVRTVLSSGNVVFSSRASAESALERKAEKAMQEELGRSFLTLVRPLLALEALVESDPFGAFELPANAKRVVTFLRRPPGVKVKLPIALDGVRILRLEGTHVFTAYEPVRGNPVFMRLIEKTFGTDVTTRTWDTVKKICRA